MGIITAIRVSTPPRIDGSTGDAVWGQATPITEFTQRELHEGSPSTERTEVRIVYDDRALYIGIWCYDRDASGIISSQMQRDFNLDLEDNVGIIIDTYHDRRNGFQFYVNPNGARADALVTDEGQGVNTDWNALWDARATVTSNGWFTEIEIPFSTLRFTDDSDQVWGINFVRNIRRKQEQDLWQGFQRNYGLQKVSRAGLLLGLKNIRRGDAIQVKPYL
ncbi:MAG TPA: carbohydrate binding family 9 domain-containing protein, partial [Bacteroidota bacterium]